MRKVILVFLLLAFATVAKANHWTPDPYQFADNMNVIGVIEINGVEQTSDQLEIGAFCNGECRGSEMLAYYEGLNRYMVFLTLYGQSGHTLDFRLFDHDSQTELELESPPTMQFVVNGIEGSLSEPYIFAFSGGSCVITANVQPVDGGTVSGAGTFLVGETCTLTASPSEHYRFLHWQENDMIVSTEPEYVFAATSNRYLTACFEIVTWQIEVEVLPSEAGTITGTGGYVDGSTCILTASPSEHYRFLCWTEFGETVSTSDTYTFTVVSDRLLTAHFEPIPYTIEVRAFPENAGVVEGFGSYFQGETCTLTAVSNYGFSFAEWKEGDDAVSTDSIYSFVVENDRSLIAVFQPNEYQITIETEPADGGEAVGDGLYAYGDTALLRATPNPSFYFIDWKENGETVCTSPELSVVVDGNHHFSATFAQSCYVVTATPEPSDGGSISGTGNYISGTVCYLTAHSAPGYGFEKWTENGVTVSTSALYSFLVDANHDLTAHFLRVPYEITVSANPEIGGTVEGGGWFYYGDVCTLNASPSADYCFSHWENSGEIVSLDSEYTFEVTCDANLTAHFDYITNVQNFERLVSVFPNPAHGCCTVVCPSMKRVEVYDMLGRKVYAVDCHSESVEIGVEQSGVYFIMVINDFARTLVKTVFE